MVSPWRAVWSKCIARAFLSSVVCRWNGEGDDIRSIVNTVLHCRKLPEVIDKYDFMYKVLRTSVKNAPDSSYEGRPGGARMPSRSNTMMRKWWDDQWLLCINDVDWPTIVGEDDDDDNEDSDAEPGLVGEDDDDWGGGKVFVVVHRLAPRVPCIGHLRRQCEQLYCNRFLLEGASPCF